MTVIGVTTGHVTVRIDLPDDVDPRLGQAAARMLPGGWRLHPAQAADDLIRIRVTATDPTVTAEPGCVTLAVAAATASSARLAYLVYTAAERTRQQRGMATVHATAVQHPDGPVLLLLGDKGAGKTTAALTLHTRGWRHVGDDLVVLRAADDGLLQVLPGKPTAAVRRAGALAFHAPKDLIGLAGLAVVPLALGAAARITVHPSAPSAKVVAATPFSVSERLRLHEMLTRYISAAATPLSDPAGAVYGPIWPLDTPTCARTRQRLIDALETSRFVYLDAPGCEQAADQAERLMTR